MVELLITIGLFLAFCVFRETQFAKERQKLLDRVQSNNVFEYKQSQAMDKPREKKEKPQGITWL